MNTMCFIRQDDMYYSMCLKYIQGKERKKTPPIFHHGKKLEKRPEVQCDFCFVLLLNEWCWVIARALCDEIISCLDFVSIRPVPNCRHTPCYALHGYHRNMATKKTEARKKQYQNIIETVGTIHIHVMMSKATGKEYTKCEFKTLYTVLDNCSGM